MITIVWLDGNGNPMPIGKAASALELSVKDLKNFLIKWQNANWVDNYGIPHHTKFYTFTQPDAWDIATITKRTRNGRIIKLMFSMELTV